MKIFLLLLLFCVKFVMCFKLYRNNKYIVDMLINVSYYAICCWSRVQMIVMNTTKHLKLYIKRKPKLKKLLGSFCTKTNGYKLIKHDKEVSSVIKDLLLSCAEEHDFMIYVRYDDEDECSKNVLCSNKIDESKCIIKAEFKFILMEVHIKDVTFPIYLVNDDYNYMIVSNRLSKLFFMYLFKTYYAKFLAGLTEEEIGHYKIQVLDHNMDSFEITSYDTLTICEHNYEVLKLKS